MKNEDCKYNFKGICCACEAPITGRSCCLGIKNCDVYEVDKIKTESYIFNVWWLDKTNSDVTITATDLNDAVKKFKVLFGEYNNAQWLSYQITNKEYNF
jgi:hypothetical protein